MLTLMHTNITVVHAQIYQNQYFGNHVVSKTVNDLADKMPLDKIPIEIAQAKRMATNLKYKFLDSNISTGPYNNNKHDEHDGLV